MGQGRSQCSSSSNQRGVNKSFITKDAGRENSRHASFNSLFYATALNLSLFLFTIKPGIPSKAFGVVSIGFTE